MVYGWKSCTVLVKLQKSYFRKDIVIWFYIIISGWTPHLKKNLSFTVGAGREGSYFHNVAMDISMACFGHLAVVYSWYQVSKHYSSKCGSQGRMTPDRKYLLSMTVSLRIPMDIHTVENQPAVPCCQTYPVWAKISEQEKVPAQLISPVVLCCPNIWFLKQIFPVSQSRRQFPKLVSQAWT